MAYQAPTITAAGLSISSQSDIQSYIVAAYQNIYGQTSYLGNDSADYQLLSVLSLMVSDTHQAIQLSYNQRSPATAVGSGLDALGKLLGVARKVPTYSQANLLIIGAPYTTILNGIVQDTSGTLWDLPPSVTIPSSGQTLVTASCEVLGTITAADGAISTMYTLTAGWTSATNPSPAVPGQPAETDAQLRARMALSASVPSKTMLAGTTALVAAVPGVTRYNVDENFTGAANANGNPAHSITYVVEGGADLAVATAIFTNRGIGALTNGTTSVTVADPNTNLSQVIGFDRPTYSAIYVSVQMHGLAGYTTSILPMVQAAVVSYLGSLQIGEQVTYSSVYGAALAAVGNPYAPVYSIRSLTMGTAANPTETSDIVLAFNQVAQGVTANVIVTAV